MNKWKFKTVVSLLVNPNYASRFLTIFLKEEVKNIVLSNSNKDNGKNNGSKNVDLRRNFLYKNQ